MVSTYNLLCPVVFGAGSLEKLGEKVQEFKGKKVFCIYDQGVKMAGIAKKVTSVLERITFLLTYLKMLSQIRKIPLLTILPKRQERAVQIS